jgi:hypothetical protein
MMAWYINSVFFCSLGVLLTWISSSYAEAVHSAQPPDASTASCRADGMNALLSDIQSALATTDDDNLATTTLCVPNDNAYNLDLAIRDFSPDTGPVAWKFLRGIANSPTFVQEYWQQRPFLIRSATTGGWVAGSFTLEQDLRYVVVTLCFREAIGRKQIPL